MHDRVILKTFKYRHEPEFFKSLLESSGIDSFVVSDDCGAVDPALGYVRGVHLFVYSKDLGRAETALAATETGK
jgi:hypothetical protein